jgi:hypothetical protein
MDTYNIKKQKLLSQNLRNKSIKAILMSVNAISIKY